MLILDDARIRALVSLPDLIEHLREAFRTGCVICPRQVAAVPGGTADRLFLSMPAFGFRGNGVAKLLTVFPDNKRRGLPTIQGAIVVFSEAGAPVALLDGAVLTHLRTGAASALASTYLSRTDSSCLVIVGTGSLAPTMAAAHCAVRKIERVVVWGRRSDRANATAAAISALVCSNVQVVASDSLEQAVSAADVVCCATSSTTPVLMGKWLKPGTFVDLVGSFSPSKRESDDTVVQRARIFVDTFEGAFTEAGDILDPLGRGVIDRSKVEGELADLACGRVLGRTSGEEITVFKSVGSALEDLAAAEFAVLAATGKTPGYV